MFGALILATAIVATTAASSISFAADPKLVLPAVAPTAAPAVTVIAGVPLTINVGSDHTFQIFNSSIPGSVCQAR